MNYQKNIPKILSMIKKGDKVLDIGGWAGTLNIATHVIDINPYKTRQKINQIGGNKEHYSKETWIQRDICDREPFPFPDNFFDFVFCSHVLEDIRDPIWVCSEIKRIGKKGYIEFPSPKYELSRGVEGFLGMGYVGNAHHRWVIFVKGNEIKFYMKSHFLNGNSRFSIPNRYYKKMSKEDKISFLFFDKNLKFEEEGIWEEQLIKDYYENIIKGINCRSSLFWRFINLKDKVVRLGVQIKRLNKI